MKKEKKVNHRHVEVVVVCNHVQELMTWLSNAINVLVAIESQTFFFIFNFKNAKYNVNFIFIY